MMAGVYLAACGAPASISGSNVKSVSTVTQRDAIEVASGASTASATAGVSHPFAPAPPPAKGAPLTAVIRPAAPPPAGDADRGTSGFSCQGLSGLGKPKFMCAPQD